MTFPGSMVLASILVVAACGGSSNNTGGDDDAQPDAGGSGSSGADGGVDAPQAAPLTCGDFAYCSTYEIDQYNDTVDSPAGGAIADGIYRSAWIVNPPSANQSEGFGDYAEAYRFQAGTYVNSDLWGRGTFSTSGTTLTTTQTDDCNLGSDTGSVTPKTNTYTYSALSDRIILFVQVSGGGMTWTAERVFLKVDDVCKTVDSVPSSAGDSYACDVSNCECNVSTSGTIDACD